MKAICTALFMFAVVLQAQADLQTLSNSVRTARRTTTVAEDSKAQVDRLITEAGTASSGEARRKMAHALALLNGSQWDQKQEYAASLVLRPSRIVSDPAAPLLAQLSQFYPASYKATGALRLRVSLAARELGEFDVPARDLIEQPVAFDALLESTPDGAYQLRVDILDGDTLITTLERPIQLAQGIETDLTSIERKLSKIQGHEGTKASIRYPYQLARVVNRGQRQLNQADFGGPWDPKQLPYDFARGVRTSSELLKALESGKDPLLRAKGEHLRHYWFEEAREPMAYRVYTPLKWDGKSKLPMVLVLHGNSRDQDYYFDRDGGILAKLAEQHGYLVATPMGYRPSAGWGSTTLRAPAAQPLAAAQQRQAEFSEKDALNVLDLVTKEYNVDTSRIYLFGHSAGGAGTWFLAQKYPEKWTAIGVSAAATRPDGYPFERLQGIPMMVFHGDLDDEVPVARSRDMVKALKDRGYAPTYIEMPGATHGTIVALAEPQVFAFFDRNPSKPPRK